MAAIPKLPVSIAFDPAGSFNCSALWNIPAGRILLLLWRPKHLISTAWYSEALRLARRIQNRRPMTVADLRACFCDADENDFSEYDVSLFCEQAVHYFAGRWGVPYHGMVRGVATME